MKHNKNYTDTSLSSSKPFKAFHFKDAYERNIILHHHDYLEIYFFIDANVSYLIEGKQYDIQPFDILIMDSGALHQPIFKDGQNTYERYVLKISHHLVQSLCSANLNLMQIFEQGSASINHLYLLSPTSSEISYVKSVFARLVALAETSGFGANELMITSIKELLIYVNRIYLRCNKLENKESFESSILMDDILQYISENISKEITTQELSEKFFISKFYLSREFKKYIGTTIHRYIVQKRLILAKELILSGLPITDVYSKCGFADYCNFFRAFKNEYGLTPKQFYDSNKSN